MTTVAQPLSNNISISPAAFKYSNVRGELGRILDRTETPLLINLDNRSEFDRLIITLPGELSGQIGRRVGYHRQIILYRRQGSMLELGEIDGETDEGDEVTRKRKRWKAILEAMEAYDILYTKVAQKLAIADEAIDEAIRKLEKKIKKFKDKASIEDKFDDAIHPVSAAASKLAKNVTDPLRMFQHLSEPQQRLAKAQAKQERLKELRYNIRNDYADDLADEGELPDEKRLKEIQAKIDDAKKNVSEFGAAYQNAKEERNISQASLFISGLAGLFSKEKKAAPQHDAKTSEPSTSILKSNKSSDYNDQTEEAISISRTGDENGKKGEHPNIAVL